MAPRKVRLNIYVTPDTKAAFDQLCESMDRSTSYVGDLAIRRLIAAPPPAVIGRRPRKHAEAVG